MKVAILRLSDSWTNSMNGVIEFGRWKGLAVHFQRYRTERVWECRVKDIGVYLWVTEFKSGRSRGCLNGVHDMRISRRKMSYRKGDFIILEGLVFLMIKVRRKILDFLNLKLCGYAVIKMIGEQWMKKRVTVEGRKNFHFLK